MPNNKKKGPVKISLGEFMGGEPTHEMSAFPTRPKERGPDDDGSFRRRDRTEDRREQETFASDGDNNWRRGGGGGGGGGDSGGNGSSLRGDFDNRRASGFEDRADDRREQEISRSDGDNNWRRGGGGSGNSGSLRGDFDDRRRNGFDRRAGDGGVAGGYSRDYDNREKARSSFSDRRVGQDNSRADSGGFENVRGGAGGFDRGPSKLGGSTSSGSGVRPRLQLKSRTAPLPKKTEIKKIANDSIKDKASNKNETKTKIKQESSEKETKSPTATANATTISEESDSSESKVKEHEMSIPATKSSHNDKDVKDNGEKKITKKREPEVVNSRAAALESAPDVKRDSNNANNRMNNRDTNERNRAPPPVLNKRFGQLVDEERGKQKEKDSRREIDDRGPTPVTNSRFAAAAEADKDVSYSRDRDNSRMDHQGPPPVVNSRFAAAAAAEADKDISYNRDRDNSRMDNHGPPPVVNSRFAAAAEADKDVSYNRDRDNSRMDNHGPPPVVNSRFAAAAEADRDVGYNRDSQNNGMDNRGPPPVANSRFAAAAEADRDISYNRDRDNGPPPVANSRFAVAAEADRDVSYNRDRGNDDNFMDDGNGRNGRGNKQNDNNDRGNYGDERRGFGGGGRHDEPPRHQSYEELPKSSVADLLKPKARPMEENILKVPTKSQSANFLKPPSKEHGENTLKPPDALKAEISATAPSAEVVDDSDVLAEFASGNKLGKDLQTWIGSLSVVPCVEKLVFHLLTETDKSNPDLECAWAELDKYGAALVFLVEDDLLQQMQVLFAVQKYCDTLGMPKIDNEYLVQAMYRAMYKYDLADDETFMLWKEDESTEHEAGKLKAVIQTVEWFNWLEEDDDEDDYEEEE